MERHWSDVATGELQSIDGYMNLALEKCEEHVDGVKKRSYGDAFVRGNNGEEICFQERIVVANLGSYVHLSGLRTMRGPDTHSTGVRRTEGTSAGVGIC